MIKTSINQRDNKQKCVCDHIKKTCKAKID